jgi:hypothetical protein
MRATDVGLHPRLLVTEPGGAKVRTVVLVLSGGQSRSKSGPAVGNSHSYG